MLTMTFDLFLWAGNSELVMSIVRYFRKTGTPSHPLLPKPWSSTEESANIHVAVVASMEAALQRKRRVIQPLQPGPQSKNRLLRCRKRQQGRCKAFFSGTRAGTFWEYCMWYEVKLSARVGEGETPAGGQAATTSAVVPLVCRKH